MIEVNHMKNGNHHYHPMHVWTKVILLAVFAALVFAFVFLNSGAVIEPRLHLILVRYERPALLLVLLLTSVVSIFGWWLFRTAVRTMWQLRESREHSRSRHVEHDRNEVKAAAALRARASP